MKLYFRKIANLIILIIMIGLVNACVTKSIQLDKYQFFRSNYFDTFKYHLNRVDTNQVNAVIFTQAAKQLSTDSFMVLKITAEHVGFEEYGGYDFLGKVFFVATSGSDKLRIIKDTNNSAFETKKMANRYLSNPGSITKKTISSDSSSKNKLDFGAVALSIVKIDHSKNKFLIEAYHW